MSFDGQREGETVELVFRRHFLTTWRGWAWLMAWTLVGIVPIIGQWNMLGGIQKNFQTFLAVMPEYTTVWYIFAGCLIVGLVGFLYTYLLWHFSYYLVTNRRVRQVRQRGIFRKVVVDVGIDKVKSVSYEVPGIGGSIFGYGTILLQTQIGDMTISLARRPEKIYNKLQDLLAKVER